jgi:formylglycine-generating enzyme required for sulfatase activity
MGTPEPKPVDEDAFRKQIILGQAVFAVGLGVLLVLIATIIIRAIRQRHRPQYSLARWLAMTVVAGVAVMGGMHWWFSTKALAQAQAEYKAALARYQSAYGAEKPAHEVTLTKPYYLGRHEVTQEQYVAVMGTNPSHFKSPNLPVEQVSWDDAVEFCKKVAGNLSRDRDDPSRDRKGAVTAPLADARGSETDARGLETDARGLETIVRLPTEAEWEYACRAGTNTTYYTGDTDADLDKAAWYGANSKGTTHAVGQKAANAWGLHDMHGNVWEWCQDYWQEQYKLEAAVDPQGPAQGADRVLRGGSWNFIPGNCRSAYRNGDFHVSRNGIIGFRIVVVAPRTP